MPKIFELASGSHNRYDGCTYHIQESQIHAHEGHI